MGLAGGRLDWRIGWDGNLPMVCMGSCGLWSLQRGPLGRGQAVGLTGVGEWGAEELIAQWLVACPWGSAMVVGCCAGCGEGRMGTGASQG